MRFHQGHSVQHDWDMGGPDSFGDRPFLHLMRPDSCAGEGRKRGKEEKDRVAPLFFSRHYQNWRTGIPCDSEEGDD
jgi:hypothetical protein